MKNLLLLIFAAFWFSACNNADGTNTVVDGRWYTHDHVGRDPTDLEWRDPPHVGVGGIEQVDRVVAEVRVRGDNCGVLADVREPDQFTEARVPVNCMGHLEGWRQAYRCRRGPPSVRSRAETSDAG